MISVIVPVYNTGLYLERVVEALLAQEYPRANYELVFVDNGSQDDSLDILRRYPTVRVLSEPERGSYAARNLGILQTSSEILAFTDSDCYPAPGWLKAIDTGLRHTGADVLLGPRTPPTARRWARLISAYENTKAEFVYASQDPMVYFGYTNNMAVRRRAMDRFGPFARRERGSDTIFVRRVVAEQSCNAVAYAPGMAVQHAELESIGIYYRKVMTYGKSRKAYRHRTAVRPLSLKERLKVFGLATRERPVRDKAQLFALLVGGWFAWWYGGLGVARSDS